MTFAPAGRSSAAATEPFLSGFAALDSALSGGFARGTLATLEGASSSGRTALLASILAQATCRGIAGILDDASLGSLYPPDLERAGVQLERALIVPVRTPVEIARCADILLRSRAFSAVVIPAMPLRAVVWSRLCGLAQKSGTVLFALGMKASTELAYFASTRVRCAIERVVWSNARGILGCLAGYEVSAQVIKHRRGAPGATARIRIVEECP